MKASYTAYKLSLKVAKRYMGLEEELQSMVHPEPPTAEISLPSSASKRSTLEDDASLVEQPKAEKAQVQHLESDFGEALTLPTPETNPHSSSNSPTFGEETTACPDSDKMPASNEARATNEKPASDEMRGSDEAPAAGAPLPADKASAAGRRCV